MLGFDPTAVGSLRPNPSMVKGTAQDQSPAWLAIEFEILEWWISMRDELVVPIPVGPDESILLIAEKEILEWWHTVRENYIS